MENKTFVAGIVGIAGIAGIAGGAGRGLGRAAAGSSPLRERGCCSWLATGTHWTGWQRGLGNGPTFLASSLAEPDSVSTLSHGRARRSSVGETAF